MIGKKLGNRYEILAPIGSGGMSQVYQARDTYLDRIVAIKVLREQFTSDEEFIRRFRREAQSAARLSHPNIVNIYDVGQDGDNHYLVMEMVKGKTLKEYIKEHGPLPIDEAIDIAKQICDGLEHAHENSIVHRDIKPHNILLTKGKRVKVTDFGIARAISTATVTHTKSIIGSVHYFSPEQAKGEVTGIKSDTYSLGIVLYEMLTGRLPFEGDTPIGIALKHIQNEAIAPSTYNTNISHELEKVVLKAIAKNPEDRYESVRKLRLDLMEVLLKKPLQPLQSLPLEINKKSKPLAEKEGQVSEDTLVFEEDFNLNSEKNPKENNKKKQLKPFIKWLIILAALLGLFGIIWTMGKVFIKEEVQVPDLLGMPAEDAQRLLNTMDLKMEVTTSVFHPEIAENHVVNQSPLPDTTVKTGRIIEVVLSKGPETVLVPNLIGSPRMIAEVNIENAGLKVGEVDEVFNDEYPVGQVVNQFPNPLETVLEKTEVDLVISKGPQPQIISMPNLVGKDLRTAENILVESGLILGNVGKESSNLYPEGFISRQSIASGQDILQGNTVDLTVSEGPGPRGRQERVNLRVNQGGQIKIEVQDVLGTRVVYDMYHQQGDAFSTTVEYYGQGIIVVYKDGVKVSEERVPSD